MVVIAAVEDMDFYDGIATVLGGNDIVGLGESVDVAAAVLVASAALFELHNVSEVENEEEQASFATALHSRCYAVRYAVLHSDRLAV